MRVHKRTLIRDSRLGMDAKKILDRVTGKKIQVQMTIDNLLLDRLKLAVGDGKVSKVVEELIREFLDSLDKDKA